MNNIDALQPGDIVVCDRFFYKHYGIYAGDGRVIHYANKHGDFGADVRVRETSMDKFTNGGKFTSLSQAERKKLANQFSREETVKRARSRIGEKTYDLLFNNCEHFALWCKYGTSKSIQVEKALTTAAVLGAVAVIACIAVNSDKES